MDYHGANEYALLKNFDDKNQKNVDRFLKSMYQYYATKGLGAVILTQVCAVLSLGFTIGFSLFLIAFINWNALSNCHDESSCSESKLISNPFRDSSNLFCFLTIVYFLLFGTFWIWRCLTAYIAIIDSFNMARFYREYLKLEERHLIDLQWYQVLEKLIALHNSGDYRIVTATVLTEHEVAMRIMRKDNYLIGLINKNCLSLVVPWWMSSFISGNLFLTKSLEWSLSFCILEYMFDEQEPFDRPEISQDFLSDVNGLKWRFQVVGLIHFMLLPFMLAFMAVHFFLQNAQQFHTSKAYLGPRQWSPLALWQFREFNELPHIFEERMNKSYGPANEYISTFHNPYLSIVARFAAYIAGAFVATLLLISFVSEGVLLYVQYGEHNLLWYLGIFSAIFAGARAFIPDETKSVLTPSELLQKVCANTHYCPENWMNNENSLEVKDELSELFQFKVKIFLMELLSVVLTPAVLCFSLPESADKIIEFVKIHSQFKEGVGAVCDFSLFDFERYGDEKYAAPPVAPSVSQHPVDSRHNDSLRHASVMRAAERPEGGKLEKSFLNFKNAHPNFEGNAGGKLLMSRLNAFKEINFQHREEMLSSVVGRSMFTSNVQFRPSGKLGSMNAFGNSVIHEAPHYNSKDSEDNLSDIQKSTESTNIPSSPIVSSSERMHNTISGENIAHIDSRDSVSVEDEISPFVHAATPSQNMNPIAPYPGGLSIVPPLMMQSVEGINTGGDVQIGTGIDTSVFPTQRKGQRVHRMQQMTPPRGGSIEMSGMYQRSRSLFPENSSHSGSLASQYNRSGTDMPSVLLSVLRQEHIDYENDFYWMNQFHHQKVNNPGELEQSLQYHSQMQQSTDAPFSPVVGMPDIYGGNSMFGSSSSHFASSQGAFVHPQGNTQLGTNSPPPRYPQQPYGAPQYHIANPYAYSQYQGLNSPVNVRQPMQFSSTSGYGNNNSSSNNDRSVASSVGGGYRLPLMPGKTRRTSSAPGLSKLNENDEEEAV